ncbi:MAG: hypothetical protein V4858_22495 [Pseudomonadota bacterium]
MTTHFDVARFCRLWRAHWAESWRDYAWFAGVTAIVDLVFIAFFFSTESRSSFSTFRFGGQVAWFTCGLFASGSIFAGRYFKQLASPGSALTMLMRPASLFEKWLLAFIYISLLFPLAYTLGYCLLNFPVVQLAKALYEPISCASCKPSEVDFSFYLPLLTLGAQKSTAVEAAAFFRLEIFWLLLLWSVQALVSGGTVFFKHSAVLRTILFYFLLAIGLTWLGAAPRPGVFWYQAVDEIIAHDTVEYVFSLVLWAGLPLLLWVVVFFHFKEREVS